MVNDMFKSVSLKTYSQQLLLNNTTQTRVATYKLYVFRYVFKQITSTNSITLKREALQAYAQQLRKTFPPQVTSAYLSSEVWPTDLHVVELWMLGALPLDGFSLPTNEEIQGLMGLMLINTVTTNPAVPGVDAIATRPVDMTTRPNIFVTDAEGTVINDKIHIGSVGQLKGKKRVLAMLTLAKAIVDTGGDLST